MIITAQKKLARKRQSTPERAKALGNTPKACRRWEITRTQSIGYEHHLRAHSPEGLINLPPTGESPRTIT